MVKKIKDAAMWVLTLLYYSAMMLA